MMTVPPQLTSSLPSFSYPASFRHPPPASSLLLGLAHFSPESKSHTNPLLPSSFDRIFAKCSAISRTHETYRNLKPTKFHYRNLKPTKFHRICLSFSLCHCFVPVWRSQHPNKGFPSLPCCPLFPIWTLLLIQHDSANSCIVDGPPPEHLSILPMKTHKLLLASLMQGFFRYRFSWWPYSPYTTLNKAKKNYCKELLYFELSPPWHLYVLLLANLLAFYLTYLPAFYLAYLLAFYLAYLLHSTWHIFCNMFWHIFWHSIWHIFWHVFWHSIWHSIWQIFWHSIWQTFWHFIWHTFWHSIWHIFWHSIWHIFWHFIWHIFWHSIWHIFWHFFWHSIWHIFWHIFWHSFYLAFYLANLLALWRSIWQTFWHFIWHAFWHSIWHSIWHTFWHSIWHIFWHSIWHIFWHFIWYIFWHSFWHSIWRSIWHIFWQSIWPLRSSGAHWARKVPGWGPAELWRSQILFQRSHWARKPAVEVQRCPVEVQRCPLRSEPGGWGPAVPTQIGSRQLRSSSAHCARKLAKRLATSWQGGSGRGSWCRHGRGETGGGGRGGGGGEGGGGGGQQLW